MTTVSSTLELEHSDSPVRLDVRNLTVVVDTDGGLRQLNQIGSGENWLGYHIATLIGLHTYFVEHDRPVPRFIGLDQPSQVYHPADHSDPDNATLRDQDTESFINILDIIRNFVDSANGKMQAIVMEHADPDVDWFQSAVIERWRMPGHALIPTSWLNEA